jgi:Integrase core domain/Chromo (CHRromatin Organisation MOdifier) domain
MVQKMRKKKKAFAVAMKSTQLVDTYYDPLDSAAYAGAIKLKKKFPLHEVSSWLAAQPTYTLHKAMRRRFPTRKYKASAPNELWQMDLLEMIPYSRINKGYRYILTCIDIFTRFARAEPLKAKDASAVFAGITLMLKKAGKESKPRYIQTDLGKEFYNKTVQGLFKNHKINHYSVHSQFKAALVERFNRTLREKLNRYFTHNGNKLWINVLPKIIYSYNRTSHRGIQGKRPVDVENDLNFWYNQEKTCSAKMNKILPLNSLVRISRISASPFRKNFDQNWSEEIFTITAIDTRDTPVMYVLKDLDGQVLHGKFYQQELQVISDKLPSAYRIEEIIRTQGRGKHKQYLVKWYGYDTSHNSWISQSHFVQKI